MFKKNIDLPFRRRLHGPLLEHWNHILFIFGQLQLSNSPDRVVWGLTKSAQFTTKSVYEFLERDLSGADNRMIWKAKIPLKIQIFMWHVFRDAIPTRHNMRKRKWQGNPLCSFCKQVETMEHLFFACPVAKATWRVMGASIGTNFCPQNLWQAIVWFYHFLPGGENFYMIGLAAICWSI
jgi:hypothetical protein